LEKLPESGIYEWESSGTIKALRLEKGVYSARAQASLVGGSTASDVLEFHIDPPADSSASTALIVYGALVLVLAAVAVLISKRRIIHNPLRRTSKQSNTSTG